jgi:SAM-dependent methyltransferase
MSLDRSGVEQSVLERYSDAAGEREDALCCPVEYRGELLEVLPAEILDRDYGCGDPSRYVREGETVVDLGSGGGKICYIASQVVGPGGRVIGIDMNDEMLALAESHRDAIGERIGHHNVDFRKGRIQDIASLVPADSVDIVVSNCVLNLVRKEDRERLFAGLFAVLRDGGRAVISDIVSAETVPEEMQQDPELWSGCISGAYREDLFVAAFEEAGFTGARIVKRDAEPWRVVAGIEFRSVTVEAVKGTAVVEGQPCCGSAGG